MYLRGFFQLPYSKTIIFSILEWYNIIILIMKEVFDIMAERGALRQ